MLPAEAPFCDLELRLFPRIEEKGYPVEITLAGQQEFPRGYAPADLARWTPDGDPASAGQKLLAALLSDDCLRRAWEQARGQAPQRRIRLRIDPAAAELHALPWELLAEDAALLAAHADTPFSRYLPIALPWGGAVEERPIRVLVAISNPADLARYKLAPLDVAQERQTLEAALGALEDIAVTFLDPPITPEKLEAALREGLSHPALPGSRSLQRRTRTGRAVPGRRAKPDPRDT